MISELSPIVVFVYARPEHTRRTLESLSANALAADSHLYVYADGCRNAGDAAGVEAVRAIVRNLKGFRDVTLIERDMNYGLARNIIDGVSTVCRRHGKAIVLEDDIVTHPYFLTFMNDALHEYAGINKVWHISGWNYPISAQGLGDAFFWRVMNCWGWATWDDRWRNFTKEPERLVTSWTRDQIARFNLDGAHEFWEQVRQNHNGRLNTWAIFWYATIFEHGGLCLNPTVSLVQNIGHDGSGENCGESMSYAVELSAGRRLMLPSEVVESEIAVERVRNFYRRLKPGIARRILRRIKRLMSGRFG